ncbi:hypothetical protein Pryu01_02441 [Paraliobacillus ryukyuensis]|uniref:Uncharacterized protein n=1 Tax=Paraliobacillus ryukyuensis TaxID=200904 RepID=A0A366DU09_9BACI|nr:hypothetical protein [Paraliobacillus ryukyuensis]RBO93572.1 hypothetical protein DES48_11183 [Paraliobacillus ryukyuensis]
MCNIETDKIIKKLEEEMHIYYKVTEDYEKIMQEQINILKNTIEKYLPVMEWYLENNVDFKHPDLRIKNEIGPILGHDEKEDKLIVYYFEKRIIIKIKFTAPFKITEIYSFWDLIRDGYFLDALLGLKYIEVGYSTNIIKLRELISEYNENLKQIY